LPDEIPDLELTPGPEGLVHLPAVIASAFGRSRSEARRLLAEGAVKVDGDPVREADLAPEVLADKVLQVGKRSFVRLRVPAAGG
jgi:tyrosyl-tRNA synthetase